MILQYHFQISKYDPNRDAKQISVPYIVDSLVSKECLKGAVKWFDLIKKDN